jgi:hypothetical protein
MQSASSQKSPNTLVSTVMGNQPVPSERPQHHMAPESANPIYPPAYGNQYGSALKIPHSRQFLPKATPNPTSYNTPYPRLLAPKGLPHPTYSLDSGKRPGKAHVNPWHQLHDSNGSASSLSSTGYGNQYGGSYSTTPSHSFDPQSPTMALSGSKSGTAHSYQYVEVDSNESSSLQYHPQGAPSSLPYSGSMGEQYAAVHSDAISSQIEPPGSSKFRQSREYAGHLDYFDGQINQ